jgi:UDP-3-O-[3-hydroxymyristoyl] glucosamine N-acyltransferase
VAGVIIGNDVHIGSNTTIDRGSLEDTIISDGVIIGNLVQIAHNVTIGCHTAIAGCAGITGRTHIGKNCKIGGRASILGHIEICDDVVVFADSYVTKSITMPGIYSAALPAMPIK